MNLYTYVLNNPINWIDPWGLSNSWNWGWWDIITFYPHAWYELGAWIGWGSEEFDDSYTGIGYGKKTVETCIITPIPGSELLGAGQALVELGKMSIALSEKNKRMNELMKDDPDWKDLPILPKHESDKQDKTDKDCPPD